MNSAFDTQKYCLSISSSTMSLTIAIPHNPAYSSLTANAQSVCQERGYVCRVLSEYECAQSLYKGTADIALIDPLSFARHPSELRIIPSLALSIEGCSNLASIHFVPGKEEIQLLGLQEDVYFLRIGALCLAEKYDLFPEIMIDSAIGEDSELTDSQYDACIAWNASKGQGALDICEEWSDFQELPLPMVFWACKDEDSPELIELTTLCAADDVPESDEILSITKGSDADPRIGTAHFKYSANFQASLDAVQHFMFYHRMIESVRAITLLGH